MIKLIREEGNIPTIVYCDQGSEFNNKLFNDPYENGFRVQFTIDHQKAVYAECAIRTIHCGLEQIVLMNPLMKIEMAIEKIVKSHSESPSRRNPLLSEGKHASPEEVIENPMLSTKM